MPIKLALPTIFLCLASILSGNAIAAPPISFDGWSVNADNSINTSNSCDTGVSCRTLVEDPGFLLQEVEVNVINNGVSSLQKFFRVIVTEKDASESIPSELSFSIENYVPFAKTKKGGNKQGIISRQAVRDINEGYSDISTIQRQSFKNDTDLGDRFNTHLQQRFANNSALTALFDFKNYTLMDKSDSNTVIGRKLDISLNVASLNTDSAAINRIKFDHRQRSGYKGTDTSSNGLALTTEKRSMTLGGITVGWNDGDNIGGQAISSTWIADTISRSVTQSVRNEDKPGAYASETRFNIAGTLSTLDWDTNFGPVEEAPSL